MDDESIKTTVTFKQIHKHNCQCLHARSHTYKYRQGLYLHILSFSIGATNLPLILALIFNANSMRVPCHFNTAIPAAGHRRLTAQPLYGVHQWFRELYIPISCHVPQCYGWYTEGVTCNYSWCLPWICFFFRTCPHA